MIYSMWEGYMKKPDTKKFIEYFENRKFSIHNIHTSGHADVETLKKMVEVIHPKNIIPIHTFSGDRYKTIFNHPVKELVDGEEMDVV